MPAKTRAVRADELEASYGAHGGEFPSLHIQQSLPLVEPSDRATLVHVLHGGNKGVKKLDGGLQGDPDRAQSMDGRAFGGEKVRGHRNGASMDGRLEGKMDERAVKPESVGYLGHRRSCRARRRF
ncbi:hypothetical protein MMC29_000697 [Sticta canariensis]|nr:hypothetical protein [Sticta canariensis]